MRVGALPSKLPAGIPGRRLLAGRVSASVTTAASRGGYQGGAQWPGAFLASSLDSAETRRWRVDQTTFFAIGLTAAERLRPRRRRSSSKCWLLSPPRRSTAAVWSLPLTLSRRDWAGARRSVREVLCCQVPHGGRLSRPDPKARKLRLQAPAQRAEPRHEELRPPETACRKLGDKPGACSRAFFRSCATDFGLRRRH